MRRRAVLQAGLGLASLVGSASLGAAGRSVSATNGDQSEDYEPVGDRPLAGTADCRVSDDGEAVFVAVGDGFATVTLPELQVVAEERAIEVDLEGGPLPGIADVAVDGDRLLVPGPAHSRPERLAGFALFDVSDPTQPDQVAFYETSFPIHNAELADGYAYLTAGRWLVIVDVTDDDPVEVGRWSLADVDPRWNEVAPPLWVLHDIRVRGDLAILSLWDAGTWIVDVSAPDDVSVVGRAGGRSVEALAAVPDDDVSQETIHLPGNHHSAALAADNSLLAVGAEAFDAGTGDGRGPGGIDLYDIGVPAAPAHLATIDAPPLADPNQDRMWTTAHDFTFKDDRLLSSWYQGGVRIHDVADPSAPRELAWWRQPREVAFWTARPAGDGYFVASATAMPAEGLYEGLFLFPNRPGTQSDPPSITDTSTPTETVTPMPTPTPTPSPTRTDDQPGFGPLAALGGLAGLAAWRRWRHRRSS